MGDPASQQLLLGHGVADLDDRLLTEGASGPNQRAFAGRSVFGHRRETVALAVHHDQFVAHRSDRACRDGHHPLAGRADVHTRHDEQGRCDKAAAEHPVHHHTRTELVGQPAAQRADGARRKCKDRGQQARGHDTDGVDVDVVGDQPLGEGDETTEHQEVVQAKAPDTDVLEWLQAFEQRSAHAVVGTLVLGQQQEPEHGDHEHARVEPRQHAPALEVGAIVSEHVQEPRCGQRRDRRARIACTEDAERRALLLPGIPGCSVGDTDREGGAGEAEAEAAEQEAPEAVGEAVQEYRSRRDEHHGGEDGTSAEAVGQQTRR